MKNLSKRHRMRGGKNVRVQGETDHKLVISRKESEKFVRKIWDEMNFDLITNTDYL